MSDLIRELKEKHSVLAAKVSKLQKQADSIWDTIMYLEEEEKSSGQVALGLQARRGRPRKPSPLINQIVEVLQAHGGVMHRRDILRALADEKGIRMKGDTPAIQLQRLGAHLSMNKKLLEPASIPGDGRWRLKDRPQ